MMKKPAVIIVLLALILVTASCTKKPLTPVNAGPDGIAIKGVDPVAYFTEGKPVMGDKQFAFNWNGATWLFSSKDHLEMFKKAPEKYTPQYGGY